MKEIVSKIYKIIAYFAIIVMILKINCNNLISGDSVQVLKNIVYSGLIILFLIIVNKLIITKLKNKVLILLISIGLLMFLFLEIITIAYFKVEYNWDFKWIMDTSMEVARNGETSGLYYYKIFPHNIASFGIVALSMMIFNEVGAYIVNCLFIFLAAMFGVLSANKIGGKILAVNTIIIMLLCCPFYLYSPIVYTDTLSVCFPVIILYIWLCIREKEEKKGKLYYLLWVLIGIIGCASFQIKAVACIVFLAMLIDYVFTKKDILKELILSILVFIIVMQGYNFLVEKTIIKEGRKNTFEYPYTHWVMMGLNKPVEEGGTSIGYGAYSQEDSDYTATKETYQEKKDANLKKIKERINDFGIINYIKFLNNKFKYVWNDGSFYVLNKIGWGTIKTDTRLFSIVIGEKSNLFFRPYMNYYYISLMFLVLISFIKDIIKKDKNEILRVLGISLVGIAIFLLIWEARSRYIYFLIPILCLLGAIGLTNLSDFITKENFRKIMMKIKGE